MGDALPKPEHLRPFTRRREWVKARAFALLALTCGALSFIVTASLQHEFWAVPDHALTLPGLVATAIVTAASLVRKERAYYFWLPGLALAAAAMTLGWFMILAVVLGVAAILIIILHSVM